MLLFENTQVNTCSCMLICGFSKDFNKVKTTLANEVIIAGPIPGPAINIWLAQKGQLMISC